jgi:GNAT superfamily N-acetyltransferase
VIRIVEGALDTEAAARIRKAVWRWIVVEPETIQHFRATWPRFRDWLAVHDGEPVGIGACGLLPGEESAAAFALNAVLREARGKGVGTAIYRQVSEHARSLDKSELQTWRRRSNETNGNKLASTPTGGSPDEEAEPGLGISHGSSRSR